jgi:glycosyltransferase involved in cell wall biosynthesis
MARGCPVVASAAGSLPEVVGEAGLLVPAGDADALAAALATILDDETEAARLGELGRRRAAGFTWTACVEGHLAAYLAALAAGSPPRSGGVAGVPS